jgi:glycosyltransferase involved in cell wall biosynthesis
LRVNSTPVVDGRLHVFLFLQTYYLGGVWEATKDLVRQLVEVNRERGRLSLTIGLHEDQTDVDSLDALGNDLRIERIRLNPIDKPTIAQMLGWRPAWLDNPTSYFSFFSGAGESAIRADAWFGLLDRFPFPLLPLRPYGVLVYDMLQKYLPQNFGPPDCNFFRWYEGGMKPTARAAHFLTVTTPQTQQDVKEVYGLQEHQVRLLPLASEPHRRFSGVVPEVVAVPREPFILKVANAAIHKGAAVLLKAYAKLKQSGQHDLPPIVFCGMETHRLSTKFKEEIDHPNGPIIRELVPELGLNEGTDVVFLGFVTESQLKYLYEHCLLVVNAGKYDNGSFSLIEATYFGKPVICSRYLAAEFICQRFGIRAKFFPVDNDETLARLIREALAENVPSFAHKELAQIRARLANPELGTRRYAERIYDCLVELAEQGRRERQLDGPTCKVA